MRSASQSDSLKLGLKVVDCERVPARPGHWDYREIPMAVGPIFATMGVCEVFDRSEHVRLRTDLIRELDAVL